MIVSHNYKEAKKEKRDQRKNEVIINIVKNFN